MAFFAPLSEPICYLPRPQTEKETTAAAVDNHPNYPDWHFGGISKVYWADQKNLVKGCRQTLDCYYVSCELLSASIADALLFVNILVSGIFHGCFAQRLAVNKPWLQIVRRLLWKQTKTHIIRNNNPMFDRNL